MINRGFGVLKTSVQSILGFPIAIPLRAFFRSLQGSQLRTSTVHLRWKETLINCTTNAFKKSQNICSDKIAIAKTVLKKNLVLKWKT